MSDWSKYKEIKSGSGDILKPESGKAYKIRVIGEPWVYTSEFQGNISTRFALTIYNQTDGAAQILMLSKTAFGDIFDLKENEEWGDPEEYDITMKRTGEKTETKYSFVPSTKKPIEPDKKAEVEAIVLNDVLSRLPSVQNAYPISDFDPEALLPKKKEEKKQLYDDDGNPIPF
jgi:hypothetical protein